MNLQEAARLVESIENPEDALNNPQLNEFAQEVQEVGINILQSRDEKYFQDAVEFVAGAILASLGEHGGMNGELIQQMLYSDTDLLETLSIDVLKVCVGLVSVEELR